MQYVGSPAQAERQKGDAWARNAKPHFGPSYGSQIGDDPSSNHRRTHIGAQITSAIATSVYQIPTPTLFLDRDGVLIEDRHYLSDPNEVSLFPGSKALAEAAHANKFSIVLITNKSGIARGYFDWSDYEPSLIGC